MVSQAMDAHRTGHTIMARENTKSLAILALYLLSINFQKGLRSSDIATSLSRGSSFFVFKLSNHGNRYCQIDNKPKNTSNITT